MIRPLRIAIVFGCMLLGCFSVEAAPTILADARQTMTFIPGDRSRLLFPRLGTRTPAIHPIKRRPFERYAHRHSGQDDGGRPATSAPPGSGFKMEDGVLTYPAPARFQPKILKKR